MKMASQVEVAGEAVLPALLLGARRCAREQYKAVASTHTVPCGAPRACATRLALELALRRRELTSGRPHQLTARRRRATAERPACSTRARRSSSDSGAPEQAPPALPSPARSSSLSDGEVSARSLASPGAQWWSSTRARACASAAGLQQQRQSCYRTELSPLSCCGQPPRPPPPSRPLAPADPGNRSSGSRPGASDGGALMEPVGRFIYRVTFLSRRRQPPRLTSFRPLRVSRARPRRAAGAAEP